MYKLFFDWSDLRKDAKPGVSKSALSNTAADGTGEKKDDKDKH